MGGPYLSHIVAKPWGPSEQREGYSLSPCWPLSEEDTLTGCPGESCILGATKVFGAGALA